MDTSTNSISYTQPSSSGEGVVDYGLTGSSPATPFPTRDQMLRRKKKIKQIARLLQYCSTDKSRRMLLKMIMG